MLACVLRAIGDTAFFTLINISHIYKTVFILWDATKLS